MARILYFKVGNSLKEWEDLTETEQEHFRAQAKMKSRLRVRSHRSKRNNRVAERFEGRASNGYNG